MAFTPTTLTGSYALNGNGSLLVGGTITSGSTGITWSGGEELNGFKSGNIDITASTVDNSARGDGGWAKNSPGSRSATLSLTANRKLGDTAQEGLIDLLMGDDFQNQGVAIYWKSGDGTNTKGLMGTFVLTSYSENQSGGGDADGTATEISFEFASYSPVYTGEE